MNKRPISITIIGWIFIITCAVGIISQVVSAVKVVGNVDGGMSTTVDLPLTGLVLAVRLLGLIGGVFLLRGHNWARWVLVVWMGFHVVHSATHSIREMIVHVVFFVVLVCFLFGPKASAYFRNAPR
jgi:hypothetical protein